MSEIKTPSHQEVSQLEPMQVGDMTLRSALVGATDPTIATESEIGENRTGLLSAQEYLKRRSDTLLKNPEAVLDEEQEIQSYFERQDQAYVKEIAELADTDKNPMKPSCRIVVTVIAYGEGSRIKHTLDQYTKLDINPNEYEIILLENHPETVADDNTAEEVAKFKRQHPNISLTFIQKRWSEDEPATVGNARKYAFDIAQARILNRGQNDTDTILVSNDADTLSFEPNYLTAIVDKFDSNSNVDALVTRLTMPPEAWAKPNVAAAVSLWDALDETVENDDAESPQERLLESPYLVGRSSAFRASIYAAVGGFNPNAIMSEDTEMGWMIGDARDWNANRIIKLDYTAVKSDPRRFLSSVANRIPVTRVHVDFQDDSSVRRVDNDELLKQIPDALDWEQFQDDVETFWLGRNSGCNERLGSRFESIFSKAMDKIGVEYEIVDDKVVLKNVDRLLHNLAPTGKKIEIVHSKPRSIDPVVEEDLHEFFSEIPKGIIGAWRLKAERIAADITLAQNSGKQNNMPTLIRMYERFAGHRYLFNS